MAITFDTARKHIVLDSVGVSAAVIWSRWVDWHLLNPQWPLAFRQVGGDDLGGGLLIPPYYFLVNGWRVRPMEANQTLTVEGNLFVDGGGDPIVPTLGVYQVLTKLVVPVQAQGISTGGSGGLTSGQAAQLAAIAEFASGIVPANVVQVLGQTVTGVGSESDPWGP